MAYLEYDGQTRVLGPGVLIIGSGREAGWRIEDRRLDRVHALVSIERDGRVVLNRGNDTAWVELNGFPIDSSSEEIKPGDEVRLGDATFRVHGGVPHAPTELRGAYLRDVRRERWYRLGENNTIGRDLTCTVLILDPDISRTHAELVHEGDAFGYKIHARRGVTLVNGHRVTEPRRLEEGDEIMVGTTSLRFTTVAPSQGSAGARARVSNHVRQAAQMQTTFMSPLALREQVRKRRQRKIGTAIAGVSGAVALVALIVSFFRTPNTADARRAHTTSAAAGRIADSTAGADSLAPAQVRQPEMAGPEVRLPDSVTPLEAAPVADEPITAEGAKRTRP
jgi:hypothetical protein